MYVILNTAGSDQRQDELFSAEALFAKGRSALKGLKGVENVYMQHTPHMAQTLENLFKGRLRDVNFPFLEGAGPNAGLQRSVNVNLVRGSRLTEFTGHKTSSSSWSAVRRTQKPEWSRC